MTRATWNGTTIAESDDTVVVEGFMARDGSPNASGGRVTFTDGRRVFTAADEDARPQ